LNHPKISDSLRNLVAKIAKEHIGGLAGLFVNPDKIFESIRSGILEYLSQPDNCQTLAAMGIEHGEKMLDRRICDLGESLNRLPYGKERQTPQKRR